MCKFPRFCAFNLIFNNALRTYQIAKKARESTFQLLSDLNIFPTSALIRGGALIRLLRVYRIQYPIKYIVVNQMSLISFAYFFNTTKRTHYITIVNGNVKIVPIDLEKLS